MGNQKISTRVTFVVVMQVILLSFVGFIAFLGLERVSDATRQINRTVTDQANLSRLGEIIRTDLIRLIDSASRGVSTWEETNNGFGLIKAKFEQQWQEYVNTFEGRARGQIEKENIANLENIHLLFDQLQPLFATRDRSRLNLFIINDLNGLIDPFFERLQTSISQNQKDSEQALNGAESLSHGFVIVIIIFSIVGLTISVGLGTNVYRAIVKPINRMMDTIQHVSQGNDSVRTGLQGSDELSQLGQAFDSMLDEKVAALMKAEQENAALNNSVIGLLQAVSQLSQRDLTVKVPVTEDVTGPVADALNLLTDETAKVLFGVTQISEEVAKASNKVREQSEVVMVVAAAEQKEVEKTASELTAAAKAMDEIARLAKACDIAAENAIKTTQTALETVTNTVGGIGHTRDTIRETEKRIKRLGERSQEISGVVNLINTIAERTHILALNASMHAASAGEAGRGFAVVADEVQRLAENAREATSQIATLVSSIQTETADTVNAMNTAISQVVEGSKLAEQAGEEMKRTQQTTADLVASVQQIVIRSQEQARVSNELLERARQIEDSTLQTGQRLKEQSEHTNNLVTYAKELLSSVKVFTLPAHEASS